MTESRCPFNDPECGKHYAIQATTAMGTAESRGRLGNGLEAEVFAVRGVDEDSS